MIGRRIAWLTSFALAALLVAPAAGAVPATDVFALRTLLVERNYDALDAAIARRHQAVRNSPGPGRAAPDASLAFATTDPDVAAGLDAWVAARPDAVAARLARGRHFAHMAEIVPASVPDADGADARVRSKRQYLAAAAAEFEAAIAAEETRAAAYAGLIRVRLAQGDRDGAEKIFRAATETVPGSVGPYRAYAAGLSPDGGGSLAGLGAFVKRAYEPDGRVDLRWLLDYWRGVVLLRQGKDKAAALALLTQAAAATGEPVVHAELASARWYAGRKDEAYAGLRAFLASRPFDTVALTRLCQFLVSDLRIAVARETCDRARRLDPLAPGTLVRLSYLERQTHDQAGRAVAPDDAEARRYLELASIYGSHDPWVRRAWESFDPAAPGGATAAAAEEAAPIRLAAAEGAAFHARAPRPTVVPNGDIFAAHSYVRGMTVAGLRLAMSRDEVRERVPGLDLAPRLKRGVADGYEARRHMLPSGATLDVFVGRDGETISVAKEERVAETDLAGLRRSILRRYGKPDYRTGSELRFRQEDVDGRLLAELRITIGRPSRYNDPDGCGVAYARVRWQLTDLARRTRNMRAYMAALDLQAAVTETTPAATPTLGEPGDAAADDAAATRPKGCVRPGDSGLATL